ncbi:myophilin-like [Neocloeon triangulifer]|uniref:myophilin-like n=1 Tax=Neocloeon triangulifer TaxID=2078957 RepID=UPI00286F1C33|nr:myophilin-like [Neocloeon triangulifer]
MAYHGPSYGLSRECQMKAQAKFSLERALECVSWVEDMIGRRLDTPDQQSIKDQLDFAYGLKDGVALCELINRLEPGTVKKINAMKAPFKQRENIEMFLNGCISYGLKSQDLFQVNDLYEHKNIYMVVDCLFSLGGLAQKKQFDGPTLGVKVANENKRNFSAEQLAESNRIIGLQYGSNRGASQAGMTAFGHTRQILPDEFMRR